MFITFEGPEGAGKSTQVILLAERLRALDIEVVTTRQPGGDELGKRLRNLLLDSQSFDIDPIAELMMMMADRAQSVAKIIRPALQSSVTVICDRYIDSSAAYQGYGRGIDLGAVQALNQIASGGISPDITYLLDIDPWVGLQRQAERTRMENEAVAFHERVRSGYLALAEAAQNRINVMDASLPIDDVSEQIWRVYEAHHRHSS